MLWPTSVRLSDEYFQSLTKSAVPLDETAIRALAHGGALTGAESKQGG